MLNIKNSEFYLLILISLLFLQIPVSHAGLAPDDPISQLKAVMSDLKTYEYGQNRNWFKDYQEVMREIHGQPELLPEVEDVMLGVLESDAGLLAKQFICGELMVYGTSRSVSALTAMLKSEDTGMLALGPLEVIGDPAIEKALVKALKKADGRYKAGILVTLGNRRATSTLKAISKEVDASDAGTASAALYALGELATPESAAILMEKMAGTNPPLQWKVAEALIRCAERMTAEGRDEKADKYYEAILWVDPPPTLQYAVIRHQVLEAPAEQAGKLKEAIAAASPALKEQLIPLIRELPAGADVKSLLNLWPDLDETHRIQLMLALADRKDPVVRDKVLEMLDAPGEDMQVAALKALHSVGNVEDVPILAIIAARNRGEVRDRARLVLYGIKGHDIEKAILTSIQGAPADVQIELIRAIGRRNMHSEVDQVMEMAGSEDSNVSVEALRVLGEIATPKNLPELISLSNGLSSRRERDEAERMLTRIAEDVPEEEGRSILFLEMLKALENRDTKILFIHVLGNLGDADALPVLREYLRQDNPEIRQATIEALSGWPEASPATDLLEIIRTTGDRKTRTLAIRGYVQLVENSDQHGEEEKVRLFREVSGLADNAAEKRMVLSGLGTVGHVDALEFAIGLMDNPELEAEAKAAVLNIASGAGDQDPDMTRKLLNRLLEESSDEDFKKGIKEKLEWIND